MRLLNLALRLRTCITTASSTISKSGRVYLRWDGDLVCDLLHWNFPELAEMFQIFLPLKAVEVKEILHDLVLPLLGSPRDG